MRTSHVNPSEEGEDSLLESQNEKNKAHDALNARNKMKLYRQKWRFPVLLLICSVVIGAYFVYDYPGILQKNIMEEFNVSTTTYGLLYTVYSTPNWVLPVFTGIIINGMGKGRSVIVFAGLCFLGNVIMILGPLIPNYWLLVVGRAVFGIGSETVMVMQSIWVNDWFFGKEL